MIIRGLVLIGVIIGLFGGLTLASVADDGAVADRAREARAAYTQGERSEMLGGPSLPRPEVVRARRQGAQR